VLKNWGPFKEDSVNAAVLGNNNPDAIKMMERAGWR
jgi:iron(III) transport system substrate-binding protein